MKNGCGVSPSGHIADGKFVDKTMIFQHYVIELSKVYNYHLSCIANMNETTAFQDLPGKKMVYSMKNGKCL